jgi:glycosyltransferase involved in cell wall biosynthesis
VSQSKADHVLNIVFLEPYYGGSHRAFVDTWRGHSRHRFHLATLPAYKWKWRMRGAAIWFARHDTSWMEPPPDIIVATDMMSLPDLRALLPPAIRATPVLAYFHENQLTYPLPPHDRVDYQFGLTNLTTSLAADAVWFNSRHHRDSFLAAADELLRRMPDAVPPGITAGIAEKASVHYPPIDVRPADRQREDRGRGGRPGGVAPRILWCHRWEYDKNPEAFFDALLRLQADGVAFCLVMHGEQFRSAPTGFAAALERLGGRIEQTAYIPDRGEYPRSVGSCDIVVSTAIQENFGIAVAEAILAGCQPVLPDRLSYRELIPPDMGPHCLFRRDGDLYTFLGRVLSGEGLLDQAGRARLGDHVWGLCGATQCVARMDDAIAALCRTSGGAERRPAGGSGT